MDSHIHCGISDRRQKHEFAQIGLAGLGVVAAFTLVERRGRRERNDDEVPANCSTRAMEERGFTMGHSIFIRSI